MTRLLILDENIDKRFATELKNRGHAAESHAAIGFTNLKDPGVFDVLGTLTYDWTLITGDDYMPCEHEALLKALGAPVAIIDGEWERRYAEQGIYDRNQEQFKRDTIHRWAHSMMEQEPGTWRRYTPFVNRPWKLRRKHVLRLKNQREEEARAESARLADSTPDPNLFGEA